MINLLPPSPVPSQIDTTFLRNDGAEFRDPDQPQFEVMEPPKTDRSIVKSDESVAEERSKDVEPEAKDEAEETTQDSVQTLLELIARQSPKKKTTATTEVPDEPKPTATSDTEAEKSTTNASDLMVQGSLLIQVGPIESTSEPSAEAMTENPAKEVTGSLQQLPTVPTEEMKFSGQVAAAAAGKQVEIESASANRLPDVTSMDAQLPTGSEQTQPADTADSVSTSATIDITLAAEVPADVSIEVVSQSSTQPRVSSFSTEELKTTFESAPKFATQSASVSAERDEVTRQIEQMISRASSATTATTTTPELTSDPMIVSETTSMDLSPLPIRDLPTVSSDVALGSELQPEVSGALATMQSSTNRDQSESSFSQSSRDNTTIQRSDATGSSQSPTAAWSQVTNSTSDLTSTIRPELREPLSSQAARAILNHVETRGSSETETLTVRLDPPELGEMTIELSKTREGLAVRVTARESVTMDMLLARGQEIEQHLKSHNVDVASMEFFSSGASDRQTSGNNRNSDYHDAAHDALARQASQQGRANSVLGSSRTKDIGQRLSFRA